MKMNPKERLESSVCEAETKNTQISVGMLESEGNDLDLTHHLIKQEVRELQHYESQLKKSINDRNKEL